MIQNALPEFIQNPNPLIYLSNNYVVLDLETTNLDKGDASNANNRLVYGYYRNSDGNCGGFRISSDLDILFNEIIRSDFIVVHGGKFELKWLRRFDFPIHKILIYDTLSGEYVRAGNRGWKLDLDSVSRRYGGSGKRSLVSALISAGVCPSTIPRSLLEGYCQTDVRETERVFLQQRLILQEEGLLGVQFLRCITTPVLADIEMNGIFLDKELVSKVHQEYANEYISVLKEVDKITGGINMRSPKQVAEFIYGKLGFRELQDKNGNPLRTASGCPRTDSDTILLLEPTNEKQERFLEYKKIESTISKKLSGYTERFMYACGLPYTPVNLKKDPEDKFGKIVPGSCTIHGSLNQSIAQTHRLTSSDPNLQNIDIKIKKVITARNKGWRIRNGDFKQLEFRIAGILSQDPQIRADIEEGHDVHKYTSQVLTKAGQPVDRHNAKPHTFKPLYGGNSGTRAEKAYYKAFRARYKVTYEMQTAWTIKVLKEKKLRTVTGLIFYWPDTTITSTGYITNTSSIFNYPVQNFATAEIAPTGVCLLWHNMKALELQSFLINEVHDSVLAEEHPDEAEILGNLMDRCLSKDIIPFFKQLFDIDLNYPLEVEQQSNSHWGYDAPSYS